jgi:transcriptional regulator with XRE-family HTH domain
VTITPAQCRAARMLAGISQAELAGVAVVPATLITNYETGVGMPEPSDL